MNIKTLTLASSLLATTAALPAAAADAPLWHSFDHWDVRVDPALGHGCFMQTRYVDGTVLRLGYDAVSDLGYIDIFNPSWKSLAVGNSYTVQVSFNGSDYMPWSGKVIALTTGVPMLQLPTKDSRFWAAISSGQGVDLRYEGNTLLHGKMEGAAAAIQSLAECQQAFKAAGQPSDPFKGSPPAQRDPFRGA